VLETPLSADGSFQFQKVPPGTYTLYFMTGAGRLSHPPIEVGTEDIAGLKPDLRNNPFPEFPVSSYAGVFASSQRTLHGVVTQEITQIRPPVQTYFFRMDVPESNGGIEHWGVILSIPQANATSAVSDIARLKPGTRITVIVNPERNGNPRGGLVPQSGANSVLGVLLESP
jgi:hypothetical protein